MPKGIDSDFLSLNTEIRRDIAFARGNYLPFAIDQSPYSILWIRKGKDTLAFGNITGAMVFQGTVIPAAAMLLIPWNLQAGPAVAAILLALLGNIWLWYLSATGRLSARNLTMSMALYVLFIGYILFTL